MNFRFSITAILAALVKLVDDAVISGKIAKDVLRTMAETGDAPDAIVEREGLRQITDTGAIEALARQIVDANPTQAARKLQSRQNECRKCRVVYFKAHRV